MKIMRKYSLLFAIALILQLVMAPVQSLANETTTQPPTWVTPINYLALGDSLAFGIDSNGEPSMGYPDYLAQLLQEEEKLKVYNKGFAYPGYTGSDVLKDLVEDVIKPTFGIGNEVEDLALHQSIQEADLITISVGANDILAHVEIDPETGAPIIDLKGITAEIKQVGVNYNKILQAIYRLNPTVQVYVMGYYNPFPHLSADFQPQLQRMLVGLNDAIQLGMTGTTAVFVPTSEAISKNYAAHLPNPQNIHLSVEGYKVVANQFKGQLDENYMWMSPDTLRAEVQDDTRVILSWKSAMDETAVTEYIIYQADKEIGRVNGDTYTFDVVGLSSGEDYVFTIAAVNAHQKESVLNPEITVAIDPTPIGFSDIEDHWAKEYIEIAASEKIIFGYEDGTFRPKGTLSRVQAVALIVRALGLEATEQPPPFTDIANYSVETQAEVAAAYQFGIVKGYAGKFNPSKPVTRAQLALMIKRSYELVTGQPYVVTEYAPFPDIAPFDIEAKTAITMLYNFDIVEGSNGLFMPRDVTQRGQATKIFVRYLHHLQ